jgi:hypothetical protein
MVVCSLICGVLNGCFSDLPIDIDQDHNGAHRTKQQEINGPIVRYLPQAHPFPLAPFPNDGATRYDPMSPTLRRLNLSVLENIEEGRKIRASLNQLEGFGVFAPITVSFEGQLDLATAHQESVFLIELSDPPKMIPLDIGDGFFPITSSLKWMMGMPPQPMPPSLFFDVQNQASELRWKSDED